MDLLRWLLRAVPVSASRHEGRPRIGSTPGKAPGPSTCVVHHTLHPHKPPPAQEAGPAAAACCLGRAHQNMRRLLTATQRQMKTASDHSRGSTHTPAYARFHASTLLLRSR